MATFYALIARGASYSINNGAGRGFQGLNGFIETDAENRVQAFIQLHRRLSEHNSEITALKTTFQDRMLGFTAEEWDEIAKAGICIKEGYPEKEGVQIQAIQETPFI